MTATNSRWRSVSLGDICEFKYGKSLPASSRDGGPYSVYGSNGPVGSHSSTLTNGTAVIIGRKGSFGEIHYSPEACWPIDTTYFVDGAATSTDLKWLSRLLPTLGLTKMNRAAAIPGLNREDAYAKRVLLPPLAQQKRIAGVLDHVDTLRAQRREAIALLDDLAQSIFLDMFDPDDTGTQVVSIDELCSLVVDCVNRTAPVVDIVTPFRMIRTTNVKSGRVDLRVTRYVEEEVFRRWNRRATPRRGDVLLTREAPVGEVGILATDDQVFLGQRLMLYRVKPDRATAEYLSAALRSPYLAGQYEQSGSGSTVKHLSLPTCRSLKVPAPDISAQRQFSARIARLDELKAGHNRHLATLDELFESLQQRAFAGQLWDHEAA